MGGAKVSPKKQRLQPGRAGLAPQGESPAQAYRLENMVIDQDGLYKPRYGLKHCKTMGSGEINHISRPGGYNARVMLIAESGKLFDLHVETGVATELATGWPTGPVAASVGSVPGGATRWLACKAQIGSTAGPVFHYDLSTLTEISTTAPGDGNWLAVVMGAAMRVCSGIGTGDALQWSKVNDVLTWDTLYQSPPPVGLRSVDAILANGPREGLLFGPNGIARVTGIPPRNLAFELLCEMEVATPMFHPVRARGRVFFAGGGPAIYMLSPGSAQPVAISGPIFRDLFSTQGPANLRVWYDGVLDEVIFWDRTQKLGWRWSLTENRWIGTMTYADGSTNMLGSAVIDQGASTVDASTQPWAKAFCVANNLVLQTDPSVATDATSSSTTTAFTCRVETQVDRAEPGLTRQLLRVNSYGAGSWTHYYKWRNDPNASWTTVTAGAAGEWHVPPSSVEYRELIVGASAAATTSLRFHSFEIEEQVSGDP